MSASGSAGFGWLASSRDEDIPRGWSNASLAGSGPFGSAVIPQGQPFGSAVIPQGQPLTSPAGLGLLHVEAVRTSPVGLGLLHDEAVRTSPLGWVRQVT